MTQNEIDADQAGFINGIFQGRDPFEGIEGIPKTKQIDFLPLESYRMIFIDLSEEKDDNKRT